LLLAAAISMTIASFTAKADTVVGSGSWQTWSDNALGSSSKPAYGGAYWNNGSGDGSSANVGWCLAGGGNCAVSQSPGALAFYGNGDAAVNNVHFSGTGSPVTVTLLAAYSMDSNTFGWYSIDPSNPNVTPTVAQEHPLVSNAHTAHPTPIGTSITFTPTSNYGFYLYNGGQTFFTQSVFNGDNYQHFAIFGGNGRSFYIGSKDTWGGGDRDFNDIVVQITPSGDDPPLRAAVTSNPEPLPLALIAGGLIFLGAFLRKKKNSD
jgi:hypothetical protein